MTTPVNDRYENPSLLSLSARDQYEREVAWIRTELLTPEEEKRLFQRLVRSRREPSHQHYALMAKDARERLVEAYQPLVLGIAQKLFTLRAPQSMDVLDLVQEGNFGLLEAIEAYPRENVVSFRQYAGGCINHAIWHALVKRDSAVVVGERAHLLWMKALKSKKRLLAVLGCEPSVAEIAHDLGVSFQLLLSVMEAIGKQEVKSIQALCRNGSEEFEDRVTFESVFVSASSSGSDWSASRAKYVRLAVEKTLSHRQREVIQLRYGLNETLGEDAQTSRKIAQKIGCTYKTVESSERHAKERLAKVLEDVILSPSQETSAAFPDVLSAFCKSEVV